MGAGRIASITDPVTLVRQLDADAIRARVEQLDRERDALLVLLRAAQRAAPRKATSVVGEGGGHVR
jgi:hypothetical protein